MTFGDCLLLGGKSMTKCLPSGMTGKLAKIRRLPHLTTSKVAKVLALFEAQNIHQHAPPLMGVHSDLAIDRFVAYTGFVRRDSIARQADAEITSFEELATMVLG
jgi:hypothetical protein